MVQILKVFGERGRFSLVLTKIVYILNVWEMLLHSVYFITVLIRVRRKNIFIVLKNFIIFTIAHTLYVYLFIYSVFKMLEFFFISRAKRVDF